MIMTALGVFILVGLKVTGPKMRTSIENHINKENMYDIYVSSPLGLNEDDINQIRGIPGIKDKFLGYYTDLNLKKNKLNVRVNSLSDTISVPEVKVGRLPENEGEIAIEYTPKTESIKVGDNITFEHESDKFKDDKDKLDLKNYKYKVVGKVLSTDFLLQANKGVSETSTGLIDTVGYVLKDEFLKKDYSFIKYTLKSTEGLDEESSKYKDLTNAKKEDIKELLEPRAKIKFDEIKEKNQKKINDASKEINDGKKKLADAKKKLEDAKAELLDGEKKLSEAKIEFSNNYKKGKKELDDAEKKLSDGKDALYNGKREYESGLSEYNEGLEKYNKAYEDSSLLDKKSELKENFTKVEAGLLEVHKKNDEIKSKLDEVKKNIVLVKEAISEKESHNLDHSREDLKLNELSAVEGQLNGGLGELNKKISELELNKKDIEMGLSKIEAAEDEFSKKKIELDEAKQKLDESKKTIEENETSLKEGEAKLVKSRKEFNKKISEARKNLKESEANLLDGKAKYEKNNSKFLDKQDDVLRDINDGEERIKDAKELLDKLKQPKFVVETRKDNDSLFFMIDSSYKLDVVSWIFPLFFFFVAILVSLTTMTRMVEEKRIEIGTYKALGYSTFSISKKYLVYGVFSSLIGGILGAILGSILLPKIIYNAYSASFVIKELNAFANPFINLAAILFGVLVNLIATLSVVLSSLRENAASLMRPKPPKKSKELLIEKIDFIWKRLSFLGKVTMRNVFRYKSRMFMTIFGIAGCTGLLFLGFSLSEAIGGIESREFNHIMKYEAIVLTDEMLGDEGKDEYLKILNSDKIKGYMPAYTKRLTYINEDGKDADVTLVVPNENENFTDYIGLYVERQFKKDLNYDLNKTYITMKLDEIRDKKRNYIHVQDTDFNKYEVKVEGVVDNYIGHYIFMPKEEYMDKFTDDFKINSYYIKLQDESYKEKVFNSLKSNRSILSVVDFNDTKIAIENWTKSIESVIYIIIICSSLLAIIVLYNLSNINIEERLRELSTIKVLGFTNKELTQYIYRETYILAVIGVLVGYLVGWGMLMAVAKILPPDNMTLNTIISFRPYLYSFTISLLFTFIVEFIVRKRLKNIDMVSSLKAYE